MPLRYQRGLFLPVGAASTLNRAAQDAKAEDVFLGLLRRYAGEGRNACHQPGRGYAPADFAREPEAKRAGITSRHLADAMRRLFAAGRIRVESYGRPFRPSHRIAITET